MVLAEVVVYVPIGGISKDSDVASSITGTLCERTDLSRCKLLYYSSKDTRDASDASTYVCCIINGRERGAGN